MTTTTPAAEAAHLIRAAASLLLEAVDLLPEGDELPGYPFELDLTEQVHAMWAWADRTEAAEESSSDL